jgi:hypothetical protein
MKPALLIVLVLAAFFALPSSAGASTWWPVQSVDTMKYSRDLARSKMLDNSFDTIIDGQVSQIAATGATHISIGTPYDTEFIPYMRRWVETAHRYNLKVWFRGNLSGWEKWFSYPSISPQEHTEGIVQFIKDNPDLFSNGDIFTSCPECENGGPGDPRSTGKVGEYREFLISEYRAVKEAFSQIGKKVNANYFSANADVAELVFDPDTASALDGIVVIDHYVNTPERLCADVVKIAQKSQARIVLGEFGAPIPDIHGSLSSQKQADWIDSSLKCLLDIPQLVGVNYWTGVGGSTALWDGNGNARLAVAVLKRYYSPDTLSGIVKNELDKPISLAVVSYHGRESTSSADGRFSLPFYSSDRALAVSATGFKNQFLSISDNTNSAEIILVKSRPGILFKLRVLTRRILGSIIP